MARYLDIGRQADAKSIAKIAAQNNISSLLARALYNRSITDKAEVEAFLHPCLAQLHNPFLLQDMQAAVARIQRAVAQNERICVYADYDADGVCAAAILMEYFESQRANACCFLPNRQAEGYGMRKAAVRTLFDEGVRLIVTVDNGVSAREEIALCNELGVDVIVTDHHQCPAVLPDCVAVINPHRPDSVYPFRDLCGAGVAYKLVHALCGEQKSPSLAFAAVATVADIVPLCGENRAIVALGLREIIKNPGLNALLAVSGSGTEDVNSQTLAFRIAPRLNAAGRMGEATPALELLRAKDAARARELAVFLNEENTRRQSIELAMFKDAQNMLKTLDVAAMRAILLYSPGWHPGVLGIVASKLVETYHSPVLLFREDANELTGSCRSIPGIHLLDCLRACDSHFTRYGGHAQAAGITMPLAAFDAFSRELTDYITRHIAANVFLPTRPYEMEVKLENITVAAVEELARLAPFGEGNPQPVLRANNVVLEDVQRMGSAQTHLRANAKSGHARIPLVAFGQGHMVDEWGHPHKLDMLFSADINTWMGGRKLQLQLQAAKIQRVVTQGSLGNGEFAAKFYDAFFYNILYNVEHSANVGEAINLDTQVVDTLHSDINGLLVVCATPKGAQRLFALLEEHALMDNVRICTHHLPDDTNTYHTVLLAPLVHALQYSAYKKVVLFDGEAHGLFHFPPAHEGQELFVGQEIAVLEMLKPLQLNREQMGALYHAFCATLQDGPRTYRQVMAAHPMQSYSAAVLSAAVFIELGFFRWDANHDSIVCIQNALQRGLHESRLYCLANGLTYGAG